jgi:diguanylate cyclase (GGDEF)-like protein
MIPASVRTFELRRVTTRLAGSSGPAKVWLLNLLLATLAVAVFGAVVTNLEPFSRPVMPWYVLAGLFYATEVLVVHFQFRREVHSFALSEIPFVLGLFFATPVDFVLASVLGASLALVIHRRQMPVKLAFNVSQLALGAAVGVSLFHVIRGPSLVVGPTEWGGALAATLVMNLIGMAAIGAAVGLSEGRREVRRLGQVFRFGLIVGLANAVVVLAAVTFLWSDPLALWMLAIPVLVLYLAYRAFMSEREKHDRLEFLYEMTTILQRTPKLDRALVELLRHTRRMFKAEVAELALVAAPNSREALRTRLTEDGESEVMEAVDLSLLGGVWTRLQWQADGILLPRSTADTEALARYTGLDLRDALVAPLRGQRSTLGVMIVANRRGDVTHLDEDDLRLLETLASHLGVALENGRMGQSLTQLNELKEQLHHQAYHDSLTGLGNRALFLEHLTAVLDGPQWPGGPAVLFVDLDDFKTVNDSLGHLAGDRLLIAVAERLRGCLRPADLAARLGGDEFAILLERSDASNAIMIGERIMDALRLPFLIEGNEVIARASVGISENIVPGQPAEELLRNADVAMYTAKAQGKGRVVIFEPQMHATVVARHALTSRLERSLANSEFVIHYQPVVNMASGKVTGVEALVRWRQPNGTLTLPGEFIPLAEETGLILPLGRWVLETACRQAVQWSELAPAKPLTLSVNLSARQVQQPYFIGEVADMLRRTGLDPTTLILEITETVMMQDTAATIAKLDALKAMGVQLAIDDFGTGYSSLSYLSRFPVDVLKMASPFVESANVDGSAFAQAIISLGHSLKLSIVAEGIERADQVQLLRQLGCDFGQGFFFAKALPADGITALLSAAGRPAVAVPIRPVVRERIRLHVPAAISSHASRG